MFGFHQRNRSLIPVRDMEKLDKMEEKAGAITAQITELELEHEEDELEPQTPRQKRNLIMIYLLFLAEAIMASSLSSQIAVLVPASGSCITADTSFLRSILECSYYFGSVAGIFWGRAADKHGRRKVALVGLTGMSSCCLTMGFARTFAVFAALRFVAGVISAATAVAGLAMLADVTHGTKMRTKVVARLPVIAVCGSVGPLATSGLRQVVEKSGLEGLLGRYPGLASQVACASLVFAVAISEVLLLEETLPSLQHTSADADDREKAGFLAAPRPSTDSLNITIMEALADDAATPRPSRINLSDLLTAPSVSLLLASYALLSLHSSTFDTLLPHLGHTASHAAGLGIPCAWLQPLTLFVKAFAALLILHAIPHVVAQTGLLPTYRRTSLAFPLLYAIVPLFALLATFVGGTPLVSALLSTIAMLAKTTLAGAAQVLVILLIMSAAPDAASTGSIIGVVSVAELFKALAVGVSGMSFYLSASYSVVAVNAGLWAALCVMAGAGVAVTWRVRETPRVGADIPQECLVWEGLFDSESEDGRGL